MLGPGPGRGRATSWSACPRPGLRSNGYSLARHVLLSGPVWPWTARPGRAPPARWPTSCCRPSVIYTPAVRAAIAAAQRNGVGGVHAAAHITGGGIAGNLPAVLPDGLTAPWSTGARGRCPRIFGRSGVSATSSDDEMARVFNLGIGMVLVVAEDRVDEAGRRRCPAPGWTPVVVGRVESPVGDRPSSSPVPDWWPDSERRGAVG